MGLNTSTISLKLDEPSERAGAAPTHNQLDIGACSDVGRVRENNEDSMCAAPDLNLFALSDGMGGMACGEVASRITVDTILTHCRDAEDDPTIILFGTPIPGASETCNRLASGIQLANRILYRTARENGGRHGMGATAVAIQCTNQRVSIAHVGDSRAYLWRDQCLAQLTQDHSLAAEQIRLGRMTPEQVGAGGLQNILTRAVGIEPQIQVEVSEEPLLDGDTILLCSDGLTHELSDKQIAGVLRDATNAQEAATQLVALANQAGGSDNVTTIVVRKVPRMLDVFSRISRLTRWFKAPAVLS